MQILIRNTPVHVDFQGNAVKWGPSDLKNRIASASFVYEAAQNPSITFKPKEGDEVRIIDDDGLTTLFTGHIAMMDMGGDPIAARYSIQCQDLNYLFDSLRVAARSFVAGNNDAAMVDTILNTGSPSIASQIGFQSSKIINKGRDLPAVNLSAGTVRSQLDAVAAVVGDVAWFLDAQRVFHWNDYTSIAPFALTTRPDLSVSSWLAQVFAIKPQAFYRFEEQNAFPFFFPNDSSGNGLFASQSFGGFGSRFYERGGAVEGSKGQEFLIGGCYDVVGDAPALRLVNPVVGGWWQPTSSNCFVISKGTSYQLLVKASGQWEFRVSIAGVTKIATGSLAILGRAYQFVVGWYDGSAVRLFVDGVQVASTPASGAVDQNANGLTLGADPSGLNTFLGKSDEIVLWDSATFGAARIKALSDVGHSRIAYFDGYREFVDKTAHYHRITATDGGANTATADDWVAWGEQQTVALREADAPVGTGDRIYDGGTITDSNLNSASRVKTRAYATLEKGRKRRTISLTCYRPGLRAGMLIDVVHDVYANLDLTPVAHVSKRDGLSHSEARDLAVGARGRFLIQKVTPRLVANGSPNLYAYDVEAGDYEATLDGTLARSL